jgi:phenylalanyl-tRNA synthetase alpha chain
MNESESELPAEHLGRMALSRVLLAPRRLVPPIARGLAVSAEAHALISQGHPRNNVPEGLRDKIGRGLHRTEKHPLQTIKQVMADYWALPPPNPDGTPRPRFRLFDDEDPIVSVVANFDDLLVPPDHVSRQPSDTFYVNDTHVLRCHTSAHQTEKLRSGERAFIVVADCFRRDEIDSTHYPVFHQMEGVRVFDASELPLSSRTDPYSPATVEYVASDLKSSLEGMVQRLFGEVECRWNADSFPFTDPSFELEIAYNNEWLELLGCGVMQRRILQACGMGNDIGWAFGIGLERVAMVRFGIPDIRLFWTQDHRFHSQFDGSLDVQFESYSKFPPCYKDVTFWVPPGIHENDIYEVIRETAGDLVESVERIDLFVHPKTQRVSHCYRINYRSMDRSLTNEEVDAIQLRVRDTLTKSLGVELR